jgi:hypothetical protein
VAKFPSSPGVAALSNLPPRVHVLPAGSTLARVYYARSAHPLSWDQFRHFGPVNSRWDHHLSSADGKPQTQTRGVYYAAADAKTCLAEVFQVTRRIDRVFQSPWLVVFETESNLKLLDLTGEFATRMGASMAIHSGNRRRARGWARDLYQAYPELQGILYAASMHAGRPAMALNERALAGDLLPAHPLFNRSLADDVMLDSLEAAAADLGYALR